MDDQPTNSEPSSVESKHSRLTRWDVKSFIPLIQPRRDVTKEMRLGGSTSGLTACQPVHDANVEREQTKARDRQRETEQKQQIQAGTVETLIFLPHLQELTPMTPMQPQRIVDQTRTEPVNVLIQRSARPEPQPQLMFEQGERGGRRE